MKPFFAIAPWEYPGADFNPNPDAIARGSVGGQGRNWWLKSRDGVIYFRDATKVRVFAIPQRFDELKTGDSEALIAIWKREIERENYGTHLISRRTWAGTKATGNFCIVLRADGSGTIREHFDRDWREFQLDSPQKVNLWSVQASSDEVDAIVKMTRAEFLDRAVDAAHFATVPEQWRRDGEPNAAAPDEMRRVLISAAQLWAPEGYFSKPCTLNCLSNSDFFDGMVGDRTVFDGHVRLRQIWDLAKWHYGYVGVEWKRASDFPELQTQYGPRIWSKNWEKWGENWRGNWVSRQYQSQIELPAISRASQHEKLEAALTLREFLRGKVPADKVESWLSEALKAGN